MDAQANLAIETVEALDEATIAITEVLDLETVLQLIVDRVRDLADATYAALGIADDAGRIERFITSGIMPKQRAAIGPLPRGHGLLGLIIREGRSYRIPDIAAHPDSYGFPPNHPPMRSLLGVPIRLRGRPIGDLYLTDKRGATGFDATDQRVVEIFARHAGIAIENARLHDRLADLKVVEERERIGRDLHDGIIQRLYGISLSLEDLEPAIRQDPGAAAARVDAAIDGIHGAIGDIRRFILGLRPGMLSGDDPIGGLASIVEEARLNALTDVEFEAVTDDDRVAALDPIATRNLLQLTREALSNIARHAQATRATVSLTDTPNGLRLTIADDGQGFDPTAPGPVGHHGLANMRDRASALGGELRIDSRPGHGTRLVVDLPLEPHGPEAHGPEPDVSEPHEPGR